MARMSLQVNNQHRVVKPTCHSPSVCLRDDLQLRGPKFGCGLAQCGACTVIMEGKAVRSCTIPVSAAQNRKSPRSKAWATSAHIRIRCRRLLSTSRPRNAAIA